MNRDTILVSEARLHPEAVELLRDHRLVYTGARFTQDELVALCGSERPVAILARYAASTGAC